MSRWMASVTIDNEMRTRNTLLKNAATVSMRLYLQVDIISIDSRVAFDILISNLPI